MGHLALQFVRALGYEVTAISSLPDKKAQALTFGADRFILSNDKDNMRKLDYGFDMLLCTANDGIDWGALMMTLKKRGKLVLPGFPDVKFNTTDLVAHELSLTGSLNGNRAIMRELLPFAHTHGIAPILEIMPMSHVNGRFKREGRIKPAARPCWSPIWSSKVPDLTSVRIPCNIKGRIIWTRLL